MNFLFCIFSSKKFWRKVHFVPTLEELYAKVELNRSYVDTRVLAADEHIVVPRSRQHSKTEEQITRPEATAGLPPQPTTGGGLEEESQHASDKKTEVEETA